MFRKSQSDRWAIGNHESNNNFYIHDYLGSCQALTIKQGGNVGIGTTAPNTHLHIACFSSTSTTGTELLRLSAGTYGVGSGFLTFLLIIKLNIIV